jgi:CRP-like cAMP-binding protein
VSVVSGVILRTNGRLTDLLLPGDMSEIDPVATERWRVLSPDGAVILFLSPTTVADMAAVPGVTHALLRARSQQHERCLELRSIAGIYDIEDRILSFFAHLARHVGRPERTDTRIPLRLEQRRVEEILRAGHTQATTAFRSLFERGTLIHDADGWLIRRPPPNASSSKTSSAPNTSLV